MTEYLAQVANPNGEIVFASVFPTEEEASAWATQKLAWRHPLARNPSEAGWQALITPFDQEPYPARFGRII